MKIVVNDDTVISFESSSKTWPSWNVWEGR